MVYSSRRSIDPFLTFDDLSSSSTRDRYGFGPPKPVLLRLLRPLESTSFLTLSRRELPVPVLTLGLGLGLTDKEEDIGAVRLLVLSCFRNLAVGLDERLGVGVLASLAPLVPLFHRRR